MTIDHSPLSTVFKGDTMGRGAPSLMKIVDVDRLEAYPTFFLRALRSPREIIYFRRSWQWGQ